MRAEGGLRTLSRGDEADQARDGGRGGQDAPVILAEISPGELIDRITILEIKAERIKDEAKLKNIHYALGSLSETRRRAFNMTNRLTQLAEELRAVNAVLWATVELVHNCQNHQTASRFDKEVLELIRLMHQNNDWRADLKKQIDGQFEVFHMTEEKSFQ